MTAIKAKSELRTILDFSTEKCSKNRIKQALRNCSIVSLDESGTECTLYLNEIKIGMYTVVLLLPFDSSTRWNRLKDYGDFEIKIYESADPKANSINLKKDQRFSNQYWVSKNFFGQLRIKHLVDIIAHCYRLHRLRAFL
jgi:hypothetical protein